MDILKYSNPSIVQKNSDKFLGDTKIMISSRKNKKYMIEHNGKKIHFGQMGFEDYTKHRDMNRRDLFRKRNHKWANAEKYSPSWLSYYLLW